MVLCLVAAPPTFASTLTFAQRAATIDVVRSTFVALSHTQIDPQYIRTYDNVFGDTVTADYVSELSGAEREQLLRYALMAAWSDPDPKYLQHVRLTFDQMSLRNEASVELAHAVYQELINRRAIDAAAQVAERLSIPMAAIPKIDGSSLASGPSALFLNPSSNVWLRRRVRFERGLHVIVVSSPVCSFCLAAADAIARDEELTKIFRDRATWIAPSHVPLDEARFVEWEKKYPEFPTGAIYDPAEWPPTIRWMSEPTPTFYFFQNGTLKDVMVGWAGEAPLHRLRDALQHVGLQK